PNVCGIYCNNDTMVLGVMQAAADLGYEILTSDNFDRAGEEKTLILIGNDGIPEAIQAVQDGTLSGTIAQKPYLMGYSALEAAILALNGDETPSRFNTPVALLTKADF
ncbi:MAG: substrate-binding domain-containing protein, partial [Clostridia bacterium]|nr:substrate-binding domain-containing protein [Clostridia bacterium]